MSHLQRHGRAISIACLASLGVIGLAACGSSSSSSSTTTTAATTGATSIPVTLTEYKIKPAASSAPAGHVTFDVTNAGQMKHQFTIIRTTKSAATVLSKQNPDDDIPGARGEIASIAPGASKTLVIKNLKAGHYAIVCALPGHYQAGMYTDFTVN